MKLVAPAVTGFSSAEASACLVRYGPNERATSRGETTLVQLLFLFLNALVVILLIAAAAPLGRVTDACVIISIVLLGIVINFAQT